MSNPLSKYIFAVLFVPQSDPIPFSPCRKLEIYRTLVVVTRKPGMPIIGCFIPNANEMAPLHIGERKTFRRERDLSRVYP